MLQSSLFNPTTLEIMATLLMAGAVFIAAYVGNKRFLEWLRYESVGTRDYVVERLGMMFIEIPPERILLILFGISFLLGLIVFVIMLPFWKPGIVFGIITTIIGWKAPKPIVNFLYRRRVDKIVLQMVDALNLMSNGLKSGLSIIQAVGLVVEEMPNPIKQELQLVLNENKLGVPLEEALNSMAKRLQVDDIEMFVTSINILKETGGNLAETFDTISTTIRERIKLQKRISAMTAMAFTNGMIVLAAPPLIALSLFNTDPELMRPMVQSNIGWVMLAMVMALEVFGFVIVVKVSKVEV